MSWQLLIAAAFGACFGSFLNVVSLRFGQPRAQITGRSRCLGCTRQLRWWELIPVISFLALRGRCATCRRPLAWQYPFVEIWVALLWVWAASSHPPASAVVIAGIGTAIVLLWIIDLKYFLLPDFYLIILFLLIIIKMLVTGGPDLASALQGAIVGSGSLFLIWAATGGRGLGFGDVKLLIPLGLLLGASSTIVLLFLAFMSGGLTAAILLVTKKATLKTAVPFGPYLLASALALLVDPLLPQRLFASFLG